LDTPLHLLYADEVNVDPDSSEFFVYPGIAIPGDRAGQLSAEVDELRKKYGYRPGDPLKFNTRDRPKHVEPEAAREIKRELLAKIADYEAKLFASFILHDIATSPEEARRLEINRICFHFNAFLYRVDGYGLVLLDTFTDGQRDTILREKFSIGLKGLPYSDALRLDRILGFHLASIGTSNFCSVIDILVGSLRYAINLRTDPNRQEIANTLLRQIAPLCLRDRYDEVDELSLFFSPKTIRSAAFRKKYLGLQKMLADAGMKPAQEIMGDPRF
jgi:hypothetical protein